MTEQRTAASPELDRAASALRSSLDGRLAAPGDPQYERSRLVFNAAIDYRPAFVALPQSAPDVALAVSFARDNGLELAVRGGGHSFAGHGASDGGLVIDMSGLKGVQIDPVGRTAWAEAGLTAGEYSAAAGEHGLATGFGDSPEVGIAGITLSGGIGFLVRRHGLTIDNLLAVELVTAAGEVVQVDAESDPDLFWALRGGGGNFGVATRLRYRLAEVPSILGGILMVAATPETVRSFLAIGAEAPEELSMIGRVMPAPPMPFIPPEQHGKLVFMIMLVWSGEAEAGNRALAPLRELGTPLVDMVNEMPYAQIFSLGGPGPERVAASLRSALTDDLGDEAIDVIFERLPQRITPMAVAELRPLGGAMARVPAEATAFAHRERRFMVTAGAMDPMGTTDAADLRAWVTDYAAALGIAGDGVYVGYMGDEGPERVREAYPGGTYERLAALKRRYDPGNLFRMNQNVTPA